MKEPGGVLLCTNNRNISLFVLKNVEKVFALVECDHRSTKGEETWLIGNPEEKIL